MRILAGVGNMRKMGLIISSGGIFDGKRACKIAFVALLIASVLISPSMSFAQVDNVPLLLPQVSFTTLDESDSTSNQGLPVPTIHSARVGFNTLIEFGDSTTSDSILFRFSVPEPTDEDLTFQCALDGRSFTTCNGATVIQDNRLVGSQSYTNIENRNFEDRRHTFLVRVREQVNNNDFGNEARFEWIISGTTRTSNVTESVLANEILRQSTSAVESNVTSQDELNTSIQSALNTQTSEVQNQQFSNLQIQNTEVTRTVLNPPFKECSQDSDLAIYNIKGEANLRDILDSRSGGISPVSGERSDDRLPISLIIYNDQIPGDLSNIIINNNQPYLKGVLVTYPGNADRQKSTNFEINKISTECKGVALIDKAEKIGGPSPGTSKPSVVKDLGLKPPFDQCATPVGSSGAKVVEPTIPSTTEGQELVAEVQNANTANNVTLSPQTQVRAQAALTPTTPEVQAVLTAGNDPADVAKYTIRGTVDANDIVSSGDQQDVEIKIFNDFRKGLTFPPPAQAARVFDSNNQFAATMQVDAGSSSDWAALNYVLHELSTECKTIPFVDRPMQIGTDASDYRTQPRNDADFEF